MRIDNRLSTRLAMLGIAATAAFAPTARVEACGGFFCQFVPVVQAGEQIIFHQRGGDVTAVVLIQYVGDAEDFSWVVPVPGRPSLDTGSAAVFTSLELATRPQFNLTTIGAPCPNAFDNDNALTSAPTEGDGTGGGGVDVLESLAVGPYDVRIVTSDDADAMATWLETNGYDLTDRGRELIAPYVELGMNFVALRLQKDRGVGDIRPLIMRYQTEDPMVPIRLTAVAAQPDMGVLVWLLGDARAIPLNYLHVKPNYTRLNWFSGPFAAYASYQQLVTDAMNEAGGHGFATDYAGPDFDFAAALPSLDAYADELRRINGSTNSAPVVAEFAAGFVYPQEQVQEILRRALPLPEGTDESTYFDAAALSQLFPSAEIDEARVAIVTAINVEIIDPLVATLGVFEDDPYLTRLYTTLSPEEMTVDPCFAFNPDLDDQPLVREATMNVTCTGNTSRWTLTLGPGTDRDGEMVIEGIGAVPGLQAPAPAIDQLNVFVATEIGRTGKGILRTRNTFPTAIVTDGSTPGPVPTACGSGTLCGAGAGMAILGAMVGLLRFRRT
jgi:hypothetical protein